MNISCMWLQATHSLPHVFTTSCGRVFGSIARSRPIENCGYRFCPYCGGSLGIMTLFKNPEHHPIAWRHEIVQEPEIADVQVTITKVPAQPTGRSDHVRS